MKFNLNDNPVSQTNLNKPFYFISLLLQVELSKVTINMNTCPHVQNTGPSLSL